MKSTTESFAIPASRFSRVHVGALGGADAVERHDRRRVGSNQDELAPSCVYHGGSVYVRESAKDWVGQVEGNDAVAIREDPAIVQPVELNARAQLPRLRL